MALSETRWKSRLSQALTLQLDELDRQVEDLARECRSSACPGSWQRAGHLKGVGSIERKPLIRSGLDLATDEVEYV